MNGDERCVLYLITWAVLLAVVGGVASEGRVHAQTSSDATRTPSAHWHLVLNGERVDWPEAVSPAPLDSVRVVADRLLDHLRREGYYYARLDSAVIDTTEAIPDVQLHARRGPQVELGALRIEGANAVRTDALRRLMDTEEGQPFDPQRFDADVQALLDRYEADGRSLAQIRITEAGVDTASAPRLRLTLRVDEGPSLWLKRIEVPDDARTSPGLIARLADLQERTPLTSYDPERVRRSLQGHPFFESVGRPSLSVTGDGGAILQVPVEEAPPGSFDLVLGYLPPSSTRDEGQLVGSGHLLLEHLFGGGRRFNLTLDRRPGQTSIFDLSASDPYLFGLPVRVTGHFRGEQRDSTYAERRYGLSAGYQFGDAFELTGHLSREVVQPGRAGTRLREGRQRIPRGRTLFYGLGVRYEAVDRRVNPRRGLRLRVQVEQGQKRRALRQVTAEGDTSRQREGLRQERFHGRVRGFVPLFDRQVLVVGGEAAVLRSRSYDRSDLFRMGGAESLRGYDEDRFLGNVTARGLLEYRLQLDRRSYAYAFGDLGYVARPALGASSALREWHPGYGIGLQLQTAIGRIRTTYALNPAVATPANGRIHFGLSVGL